MVNEHDCCQLEKIGAMGQLLSSTDGTLKEVLKEQKDQGLLLAEVGVKIGNVEREVFKNGQKQRGVVLRQVAIPAGAVVAVLEGLRWVLEHLGKG